jgi:hypothetical protein
MVEGKRNVDLDVVSEVQRELAGEESPTITYKGETFELPTDLPLDAVEIMAEISERVVAIDAIEKADGKHAANIASAGLGRLYLRLGEALLEDEWERFRKLRPGLGILAELAVSIDTLYPALPEELGSGKGSSSSGSSGKGSRPSRPSSRKRSRR